MNRKIISLLLASILLVSFLAACSTKVADSPQSVASLTLIHMNDVHGRTQAEPYISQLAKDIKARGGNVLILDAGDRLQGQLATNLSRGESMSLIMNMVGYNAMTPGNHDFSLGVGRLAELSKLMNFRLLAANVKDSGGRYLFDRYAVFRLNGLVAGVFGIATPETLKKSDPRIVAGLIFEDPVESAAEMVEILKAEKCDIIIALAHLGESLATAKAERSDALTVVRGIDVIIDGHSHTRLEKGRMIGDTLIVQTGEYAQSIGIVEITLDKGSVVKTARLEAVPGPEQGRGAQLLRDDGVVAIIAEEEAKIAPISSLVVGYAPVLLEGERKIIRTGETNLANLITDSMLYATGADISFLTGGNIRASLKPGDITLGDALTALPYSNLIVTVELKGADLLEILEHGVSKYPEPAGQYIQVGGLRYVFDPGAEPMHRIVAVHLADGGKLRLDETYTVTTIEFIAVGGDGYSMMARGSNMVWYQSDVDALVRYLGTGPSIMAGPEGRVGLISSQSAD